MFYLSFNPLKHSLSIVCAAMITSYLETHHYGKTNDTDNDKWQIQVPFGP